MIHYTCDGCGRDIPRQSLRYIAKMDIFAAYDTLEITRADLERDIPYEIRQILEGCGDRSPEELLREVYANFRFDLCPDCHGRFLKRPLWLESPFHGDARADGGLPHSGQRQ